MLRLSSLASRSAINRSTTILLPFLQSRPFHQTCTLQEAGTNLYAQLLADLKNEEPKPRKRGRPAKKTAGSEAGISDTSTTKGTRRKKVTKGEGNSGADGTGTIESVGSVGPVENAPPKPKKTKRAIGKKKAELTPEQLQAKANKLMLKEIKTSRIPISLLENPWEDVTRFLGSAYKAHTPLGDNKRAHVISESLCDDALERLEPTLERHVGCDIIDINPGVCLWSSKLHERLKPRKHILLEPDMKLYRPFILPLLSKPDSKYEVVPKSGIVWSHLETVLSKETLPFQERYEKGDPRQEDPNDTLIVIANLGYYPMKPYRGFASLASLVLYQFINATRSHSLFQRYGKVRFMIWTNDEEKRHLLPREISQRRKTAVEAEVAFEKICEIASSTEDKGPIQRERKYDLMKGQEVLEKMKNAGIRTPPGRESVLAQEITNPRALSNDSSEAIWSMSAAMVKELRALEASLAAGEFAKPSYGKNALKETEPYARLRKLQIQYNFIIKRQELFTSLLEDFDALATLQKDLHFANLAKKDTKAGQLQFVQLKEAWQDRTANLPENFQSRLFHLLDNHRTIAYDPPLLSYDRREFEPLLVQPEEFYPPQPMCLLDFHPGKLWPILRDDQGNNNDVFEFVLGNIFHLPTQSVQKALKSLWPGAYEWIIEQCPSLSNPMKGGALDIDMLTVRCLTEEMLEEIITAWSTWPFRPSKYELLSRMGAAGYDPDELEIK